MCGRYTLTSPVAEVAATFGFPERPNLPARFNIAPTQQIAAVRRDPADGRRHLALLRWGLVPSWAKDAAIGSRMINARAETLAEKPAFRSALKHRRCLIPADGFYEWRRDPGGGPKQPFRIVMRDGEPFALAGLWEVWKEPREAPSDPAPLDQPLESATIVTTAANAVLRDLHDRMPVILAELDWDAWLDPAVPPEAALALLKPCPEDWLDRYPVSTRVNSVRNDDPTLIEPVKEQARLF
jgi:putative SOS response-associated peptidase YedK